MPKPRLPIGHPEIEEYEAAGNRKPPFEGPSRTAGAATRRGYAAPDRTTFRRVSLGDVDPNEVVPPPRRGGHLALLLCDLDDFKNVNDTLGHGAGDEILERVGERLRKTARHDDIVARLGGDEFALLLDGVDRDTAMSVAARIISGIREPFVVAGREISLGVSIGVATSLDGSVTGDQCLQNADVAMYLAKRAGKNRFAIFRDEMLAELVERSRLADDLRQALTHGAFEVHHQPIVDISTRRPSHLEALIRWKHPEWGVVSPGRFIPVAEETGLIVAIGAWILNQACNEIASLNARLGLELGIAVNVSGRQLAEAGFVDDVRAALQSSKIEPSLVTLEITESVLMTDPESVAERLESLKALGVRVAVDDFGTGYSSLNYLQRFPIDDLKIDKAFVDRVAQGPEDAALAKAIINMCRDLGLRTIAEGIESLEQLEKLSEMNCDLGQGFYISRPLTREGVSDSLIGWSERVPSVPAAS